MDFTQRFFVLLLGISLTSCDFFISQEKITEDLVEEELYQIDWNEVDQYPLFDACRESLPKPEQRACFESTMLEQLSKALEGMTFEVDNDLNDTVLLDFKIDEHGFIRVQSVEERSAVLQEIEDFNATITKRLNDLTTVAPALKRGVPVSIQFRLPVVLNTNNP
ncbi:MAG: hypothetical protein AAFU57_09990 [Bacteroidota bacterium]